MNCPNCNGVSVEETGLFDLTLVDRTEARHDFQCNDCGCLFQIVYTPDRAVVVGNVEDEEFERHIS
jgi:transcription elongation factor Elf1